MAVVKTNYDDYIHEPNARDLDHLPGNYGLPVLGHIIDFVKDPFVYGRGLYEKYGPVVRMSSMGTRGIIVMGPELVQQVLLDNNRDYSSKMGYMDRVAKFFNDSVIMEDFEHHRHQRRILQTAFKNDALKHYTNEVNRIYERNFKEAEADVGKTISFFQLTKTALLEIAAEVFIGEKERGEMVDKLNKAFMDCANGPAYMFPLMIPGTTYYKGMKGKKFLANYFNALVPKKRAGDGLDMLSHFCREKDEESNYYTDTEIANQATFLMFAAHDTTTAAITHAIYYMSRYPEVKEKLYEECKSLGKDQLDYLDLDEMPYMQQVFNEILRIRPSAPIFPRRTVREVELGGHRIPAHTMVMLIPRVNHYLPEYWTDPDKFDPDRFSPERAEHKQHPFLYFPFGGGAHKCIGMHFAQMEFKCFLHQFMLKYDFEAKHKKDPLMITVPIPKPADEMPIKLIRRTW